MKIINVNASKKYDVIIENGLIDKADEYISPLLTSKKVVVITDDKVENLYFTKLAKSLEKGKISIIKYVIKNGEQSKNSENYIKILNYLAENHISRQDTIIAFGGGVVGDLSGFVAATYLRGVKFIQIPTTLLAMVDSSVGGKTAIDLQCGKNLAGAFYQPELVICDLDTLNTLEKNIFSDGCAEVIKYGIIYDKDLFSHLQKYGLKFDREYVVSNCVKIKSEVVEKDEFDGGIRQILNFGHTIGHAVEKLSNFELSHGTCVAIGSCIIANACFKDSICSENDCNSVFSIIEEFNLKTSTDYSLDKIYNVFLSDKKVSNDSVNAILFDEIGHSIIKKFSLADFKSFMKAGLE